MGAAGSMAEGYGASPLRPSILQGCLARQAIACRACSDACDPGALRFAVKPGGVALPHALFDLCSGCGICADVCPVSAIAMHLPDENFAI